MSRASDSVARLEDELEAVLAECDRLGKLVDELESDLSEASSQLADDADLIERLEAFQIFIEDHFPAAMEAWAVRRRMEKASSTDEKAQ